MLNYIGILGPQKSSDMHIFSLAGLRHLPEAFNFSGVYF